MRQKAKIDKNQNPIVELLRKSGFGVVILSQLGSGKPDLMVSIMGLTILVELKKDAKSQLTEFEEKFFENFQGHLIVCDKASQIVAFIMSIYIAYYKQNDFLYDMLLDAYKKVIEGEINATVE